MKNAEKKNIIVSGAKPSGKLHIGNYVGALQNWVKLQDTHQCFFFVADLHQMAEHYDPTTNQELTLNLAMDMLAAGLDPKKCTIFVQSDVPEHTELFWIFNGITPISFLERMTQYKDKSIRQTENINAALLEYPILQAADILIYKANRIPVGRDQVQHIELTRDIARFFNNKFGQTFEEPQSLLTEVPKLHSLTDPLKKMSKSFGEKSYIALTDEPEEIMEKMKRAVTESTGIISLSEEELEHRLETHAAGHANDESLKGIAGVWNLLTLLKIFGQPQEADRIFAAQPMKYGELKKLVAVRIADHFADFRERRKKLEKNPEKVKRILAAGAKKARLVAQETMKEVRKKTGLR